MLAGHPCKITAVHKSKPGKHGHAKVVLVGTDVFTGKKHEDGGPAGHNMDVPVVTRRSYLVLNVQGDGYLSLWDHDAGAEKVDVKTPEGHLGQRIEEKFKGGKGDVRVVVLAAVDKEIVVDVTIN